MRQRQPLEKSVQKAIVTLFRACRGFVYSTSQGYRRDPGGTRMTPGLSDLVVLFPTIWASEAKRRRVLFWEVKRPGAQRTAEQVLFGERCLLSGVFYGWGDLEAAKTLMREWGLVK